MFKYILSRIRYWPELQSFIIVVFFKEIVVFIFCLTEEM